MGHKARQHMQIKMVLSILKDTVFLKGATGRLKKKRDTVFEGATKTIFTATRFIVDYSASKTSTPDDCTTFMRVCCYLFLLIAGLFALPASQSSLSWLS